MFFVFVFFLFFFFFLFLVFLFCFALFCFVLFFVKMDKIGKGIDLREEKWGSPNIQESKLQVKLAHVVANTILACIFSVACARCMTCVALT